MPSHSPKIILYDLHGKKEPWNFNASKTRQLLHAKGLPFSEQYVTYMDMRDTFLKQGFEGNPNPKPNFTAHTIPIIKLEHDDGKAEFVMDSEDIARRIEEIWPGHGLKVDQSTATYKKVDEVINKLLGPAMGDAVRLAAYDHLIAAGDQPYFKSSREKRLGMDFDAISKNSEKYWEQGAPVIAELGGLLLNKPGPFLEGQTPTYGDVRIASVLSPFYLIGTLDRVTSLDEHGGLMKLWKATEAWRPEFK